MTLFGRDRRRKGRRTKMATVVFTVQCGRTPGRVSSPVTGSVNDITHLGMSVVTPKIAPDGLHVMYDTLMTTRNRVDATIFPEGGAPIRVTGKVIWFRGTDRQGGAYVFGMEFDVPCDSAAGILFE